MKKNRIIIATAAGLTAAAGVVRYRRFRENVESVARAEKKTLRGRMVDTRKMAQSIGLRTIENARTLAGYKTRDGLSIKRGVLLRSAELFNISEDDIRLLKKGSHLAKIIDLRMSNEVRVKPDIRVPGVKNVHISILDEEGYLKAGRYLGIRDLLTLLFDKQLGKLKLGIKAGYISEHMYIDYLSSKTGKDGFRRFFHELLTVPVGHAVLFHCTQGKDRTGLAAMLILSALGVDEETIMKDYLLTNTYFAERIARQQQMLRDKGYGAEDRRLLMAGLNEVNSQFMRNALNWLRENYGSAIGYITDELGITLDQIKILKKRYLE